MLARVSCATPWCCHRPATSRPQTQQGLCFFFKVGSATWHNTPMLGCPVPGCAGAAAGGPLQELADWRDEVPAAALAPGRAAAAEPRFLLACETCATLLICCWNCRNLLALPAAWSEPAPPATAPSAGTASAGTAAPAALTHCTFCSLPHPLGLYDFASLDFPPTPPHPRLPLYRMQMPGCARRSTFPR